MYQYLRVCLSAQCTTRVLIMVKRMLAAAWLVVGLLLLMLVMDSALKGVPKGPSLDDIIRANLKPPHDWLSLA